MLSGKRFTAVQREWLVELFESGVGYHRAARVVGCNQGTAQDVFHRWCIYGTLVLMNKSTQTRYPFKVKLEAVTRFLQGETGLAVAKDLQLSSPALVSRWVRVYKTEGEEGLRDKPRGRHPSTPGTLARTRSTDKASDEVAQLRRRIQWLEMENAYLKALRDFNDAHE